MTERKSARSSGSGSSQSGRKSASSLTDAVVAALAEVEKSRSDVPVPADLADPSGAAKAADAPPASKREDTAPFERPRVESTSKAEAKPAEGESRKESFENDATLQDSAPPEGAAVATS